MPLTVRAFETITLVSLVWSLLAAKPEDHDLLSVIILAALTIWITRGRSSVARLIYTGTAVVGLIAIAAAAWWGYIPMEARLSVFLSSVSAMVVAFGLLWWPSTSDWLKEPPAAV